MTGTPDINEYIQSLKTSPRMGDQVAFHTVFPEKSKKTATPAHIFSDPVRTLMAVAGPEALYTHQAEAIDCLMSGRNVVVATPTASGKTLAYALPTLEFITARPSARALYLFPLKALAQDQLRTFTEMAQRHPVRNVRAAIYDGDTSAWRRKQIRRDPPQVILSNPEMLHLSFLPHHPAWSEFLSSLSLVVVDEVHTYRGIMGSHMAMVFRRFLRILDHYGASPRFFFSSATVANPSELAEQLTGLPVATVDRNGAPRGRRHFVIMDPVQGPAQTAILLLKAALHRKLRTIVYVQSRKMAELIALWSGNGAGSYKNRISAYRAGFLPEERRDIESRLTTGDLLAVVSTSALELGIDIGDLDLCLLVGYPGTIVATLQRSGRVGRSGQDAAVILIPGEDALDRYFLRNPLELVSRPPEAAVVNPFNPEIVKRHLVCAAAELPIKAGDSLLSPAPMRQAVSFLEHQGGLLRSADGDALFSGRKSPHRDVDLRGTGLRFAIRSVASGAMLGEIDGFRAFRETHPGAVYLHNGETYRVERLDLDSREAWVAVASLPYYTRVQATKETEILDALETRTVSGTRIGRGRLKVTETVTGFEKWRIQARQKISVIPLNLPPHIFETEGLWIEIPFQVRQDVEARQLHFMGGIHAVEHAAIGIFPLLVMADRNDLGGISTPFHPQVKTAAVFIYDGVPGGAGLTRQAFRETEGLLRATLTAIRTCPCASGCPSCVHSPRCGSGNRPIDKAAAVLILNLLSSGVNSETNISVTVSRPEGKTPDPIRAEPVGSGGGASIRYGVLDVETRRSADEVGGWRYAHRMGISCAVLYDSGEDRFLPFLQEEIEALTDRLKTLDLVVGFNIKRFDYPVLSGLSGFDFRSLHTLDILEQVQDVLGYRLSLDHLARVTLDAQKTADGLTALRWWKEGRIQEIIDYCRMDVSVTKDLYLFGLTHGYLLFRNKSGAVVRVRASWGPTAPP